MDHRTILITGASLVLMFSLVALAGAGEGEPEELDIVETAIADGSFDLQLQLLGAAGLTDLLKGDGPFTVFAPSNEALAALPEGELDRLQLPENKAELQGLIKYHILAGEFTSADLAAMTSATTLQGGDVSISVRQGTVKIGEANIIMADIDCKNGVIHVIDAVLVP